MKTYTTVEVNFGDDIEEVEVSRGNGVWRITDGAAVSLASGDEWLDADGDHKVAVALTYPGICADKARDLIYSLGVRDDLRVED